MKKLLEQNLAVVIVLIVFAIVFSSCGIQMGNYDRWKEVHGNDHCLNEIQQSIDRLNYYVTEDVNNGNMTKEISVFYMAEIFNIQAYIQNLKSTSKVWQASDGTLHTGQVEDYYYEASCKNCDEID